MTSSSRRPPRYLTATLALYDGDDYLRLCEHHLANWPTTI